MAKVTIEWKRDGKDECLVYDDVHDFAVVGLIMTPTGPDHICHLHGRLYVVSDLMATYERGVQNAFNAAANNRDS